MVSESDIELARRFHQAFAAEDWAATFELLAPDHELIIDPSHPDAGVYRGHAGARKYYGTWLGTFSERSWTVEAIAPSGDDVTVVGREHGRGKGSGVPVERIVAVTHSISDGQITRTHHSAQLTEDQARALASPE